MNKAFYFLVFYLCMFFHTGIKAQKAELLLRGDLGIGVKYDYLNLNGAPLYYSPGGTVGLAFVPALGYFIFDLLQAELGAGYSYTISANSVDYNGSYYKSSFVFDRAIVTGGFNQLFPNNNSKLIEGGILGAGLFGNIGGKVRRVENNMDMGTIYYAFSMGFYLQAKLRFNVGPHACVDIGAKYRNLKLNAREYSIGPVTALPRRLGFLNATGLDLFLIIVIKFPQDSPQ